MGGATFTILCTLIVIWFAPEDWRGAGKHSLIALIVSHLITTLIKKKVQRIRPFRILEQVKLGNFPLKDYSFPSGHTTAIFAVVTPFLFLFPMPVSILLILLALLVGLSRVYWGYHFPSDCVAGGTLGTVTALLVVLFIDF